MSNNTINTILNATVSIVTSMDESTNIFSTMAQNSTPINTRMKATVLSDLATVMTTTSSSVAESVSTGGAMEPLDAFRLFICAIGSLANLVVIVALIASLEFLKTVTSWYILQLAIADLVFLLTIPFKVIEDQNNAWTYSVGMCRALQSILFINYYASITFLTVMAIDRYIAICHSFSEKLQKLRSKKAAYIVTIFVWCLCILLCLPIMLYSDVQGVNPTCKCNLIFPKELETVEQKCLKEKFTKQTMPTCLRFFNFKDDKLCQDPTSPKDLGDGFQIKPPPPKITTEIDEANIIHKNCQYISAAPGFRSFLYFNFFGMFVVPFIIVCVCYALIIWFVKKTQFRGDPGGGKSAGARNRNRIVIMCATLVIVFVLCWVPYHAQHLAKMNGIVGKSTEFCTNLTVGTTILIYLNSAINPFLYSLITHCRTKVKQIKETKAGTALASLFTKNTSAENSRNSRAGSSSYVGARKESSAIRPENIYTGA